MIAAVEGYAVAGGMELALWCDMRIMDESAIMGIFCRRFGECSNTYQGVRNRLSSQFNVVRVTHSYKSDSGNQNYGWHLISLSRLFSA